MSLPASSSTSISETNQKREHIFLGSSDSSMSNQVFLHDPNSPPFIRLPFPPRIDPHKLISNRNQSSTSSGSMPARTPNAFILYRKIFIESAHKEGYHLPMTVISSMASKSWKREPDIVKDEYKRISKQAFEIRKQLLPKPERKMKKEKWNFVSFSKRSNLNDDSNKIEMKISGNYQDNEIQQKDPPDKWSNNVDDEYSTIESSPNSMYNMHNPYIDNKNNGFDEINELSHHSNNTNNIYDINQHTIQTFANSTDSVDIPLMPNMSNSHFQPYYMNFN